MTQTTRQEIFAQAAKKLRHDFDELKATIVHSGLKGGEAEELVRKFLKGHLPKRFDAGSGLIIDPLDQFSKQTDVIIYDALNCPVYRASEKAAIIPSDNVAAVVEVKSRLDKEKMREAFDNARSVKGLAKTTDHSFLVRPIGEPAAEVAHPLDAESDLVTRQTLCLLFVFETPLTLEKLSEHYHACVSEYGLGRHIDMVLVLDKGVIMLATKPPKAELGWAPTIAEGSGGKHGEGAHVAVAMMALKEDGLDFFLRFLLAHLIHFRTHSAHPGFWLKGEPPMMMLTYLGSITHETDPVRRDQNLRQYADQVREEFLKNPMPTESREEATKQGPTASDTPDVIYLPGPKDPPG